MRGKEGKKEETRGTKTVQRIEKMRNRDRVREKERERGRQGRINIKRGEIPTF